VIEKKVEAAGDPANECSLAFVPDWHDVEAFGAAFPATI
jgi:hypothetical protein